MSSAPKVCLLIPYFDADAGLLTALSSVESDSLLPDVCVVDDGSQRVPARDVLARYTGPLSVHLIELPRNLGIEHALNAGLDYCIDRYPYIARLDCGDRNIGQRLVKQLAYLEDHPDHALIGGWANFVDLDGRLLFTLKHPVDARAIRKRIFLNAPFTHPAVMMRSAALKEVGFYPDNYPAAEDLALFFKIVRKYPTANLPYPVVMCEVNPDGISTVRRKTQIKSRIRLILHNFDGSFMAFVGFVRGVVTYCLPRGFTIFFNRVRSIIRRGKGGPR